VKVREVAERLELEVRAGSEALDRDVSGGYASDLLSDVMANSKEGNLWVTLQIHQNIVAVASLKELTAIILINNRSPEEDTIRKADEEGIPILVSRLPAFEIIGKLYELGITGR